MHKKKRGKAIHKSRCEKTLYNKRIKKREWRPSESCEWPDFPLFSIYLISSLLSTPSSLRFAPSLPLFLHLTHSSFSSYFFFHSTSLPCNLSSFTSHSNLFFPSLSPFSLFVFSSSPSFLLSSQQPVSVDMFNLRHQSKHDWNQPAFTHKRSVS